MNRGGVSRPSNVSLGLFLGVLALPSTAAAQNTILEVAFPARAIPMRPASVYLPCGARDMCLRQRSDELTRIDAYRFEGSGAECRFIDPDTQVVEQFACGTIVVGVREGAGNSALDEILAAAGGTWSRISPSGWRVLSVPYGTERSAMRNIIFHPAVSYLHPSYYGRLILN